jgi:inorganic triphosphatase YgiF
MIDGAREIELKLEVPSRDLARLRRHPRIRSLTQGRVTARRMRSVYFDTGALDLARQGIALHVHRRGRVWVQTVEVRDSETAQPFGRREIESSVSGERPELDRVPDLGLRDWLEREVAGGSLEPIIETDVRRSRRRLRANDTELLFDLDVGEVRTRAGNAPICELQLSRVRGDPAAPYELALELHETIGLRPAARHSADLGFAKLTGERPVPRKSRGVWTAPDANVEAVLTAVVESCLEHILANERPAYEGLDPEGVHQMRVGVRRLRSGLSLFSSLLPPEQVAPLREELRWLAGELGAARDLDVLLEETIDPLFRRFFEDPAFKRLRDETRELRATSYSRVRRAIDSPRYPRLLLCLGRWLAARAWRAEPPLAEGARLLAPARDETGPLLEKRHQKVCALGCRAAELSLDEKHRLRLQLKKLRYAAEFLRCVHTFEPAEADGYIKRLTELQDVLGRLNDVATADRLLGEILAGMGPDTGPEHLRVAGFVTGWTAHRAERGEQALVRRWTAFAGVEPFWTRS